MPRRHVETEIRYHLTTGCARFPAPPPRPIIVTPDPWLTRVTRHWRCRWLLMRRRRQG